MNEKAIDTPPSNGSDHDIDHEKHITPGDVHGYDKQPEHDGVPENFREEDFMTRNGLNLRSFQRRMFPCTGQHALATSADFEQVIGELGKPNWIVR